MQIPPFRLRVAVVAAVVWCVASELRVPPLNSRSRSMPRPRCSRSRSCRHPSRSPRMRSLGTRPSRCVRFAVAVVPRMPRMRSNPVRFAVVARMMTMNVMIMRLRVVVVPWMTMTTVRPVVRVAVVVPPPTWNSATRVTSMARNRLTNVRWMPLRCCRRGMCSVAVRVR